MIKKIAFLEKMFSGTLSRSGFWKLQLFWWLIVEGVILLSTILFVLFIFSTPLYTHISSVNMSRAPFSQAGNFTFFSLITPVILILLLIPFIGMNVRRLRDSGSSLHWLWLLLLPGIGWLVLLYPLCKPSRGLPGKENSDSAEA